MGDASPARGAPRVIKVAAESVVTRDRFLGIDAVVKERRPKRYRDPAIDRRLASERIVQEARLIPQARRAGVRVPAVLDVDLGRTRLVLEFVPGPTAKEFIERARAPRAAKKRLCREIGRMAGLLHAAGIVHGDLTTSNVIVSRRGPVMIDFGLARRAEDDGSRGADLILLEHAFRGLHPEQAGLLDAVWAGYRYGFTGAAGALRHAEVIRSRRRYA
jgi:Kae1-associated kinase Bud32